MMTRRQAKEYRKKIEQAAAVQTDEAAVQSVTLYPRWEAGIDVDADSRYQCEGKLYKAVQSHTTQADWKPDNTPALWAEVRGTTIADEEVVVDEYAEWVQPTGAHDAYNKDDKVSHNGLHWTSDVDNNVWEPSVYGWTEIVV